MRLFALFILLFVCVVSAQTDTQPELVFQMGSFNQEGSASGSNLYARFYVKGGKFGAAQDSLQFGRISYGVIEIKAPDGSSLLRVALDGADPRQKQRFILSESLQTGDYRISVAFIHRDTLWQFEQSLYLAEKELLGVPSLRTEMSKERLSIEWDAVTQAQAYEVTLLAATPERIWTLRRETLTDTSLVLELGELELKPEHEHQIIVTALSSAEARSSAIQVSESSLLLRLAQSEANSP